MTFGRYYKQGLAKALLCLGCVRVWQWKYRFNPLALRKFCTNLKKRVKYEHMSRIKFMITSYENAHKSMSENNLDDTPALVHWNR